MDTLSVRAFRATDEPGTCALFIKEHARVLEDFGIRSVLPRNNAWVLDPDCYVVVAEHDQLGLIGGVRVEVSRNASTLLPICTSVGKLDPRVVELVARLSETGVGELCGLWNANRFAGRGLPHILGIVGISIANQIGVQNMVGVLAKYTLKYALRLGFTIVHEVGQSGIFDYPMPGFLGIVCGTTDTASMHNAEERFRKRIMSLRLRPEQVEVERTGVAELEVHYRLMLRTNIIDLNAYRAIAEDRLRYSA